MSPVGGLTTKDAKIKQSQKTVDFVHLHNHTHYSLLDGLQKVKGMLDKIEGLGQTAVAITDHGTLSGAIEFYKEAKARGIKPIIGMEAYVAPRKHTDRDLAEDRNPYHLTLLAKNETGYKNLMKLSTIACLDGFYYKPRLDHDLIEQYKSGIICLSGCVSSEVGTKILNGDLKGARETVRWYKNVFGKDHYFLEMQPHIEWEPQKRVNDELKKIAAEENLELVITGDAHYTNSDDHDPHDILLCVQTGSTVEDPKRMKMEQDLSLHSGESILAKFPDHPEAVANSVKIANMCNLELKLGKILIPTFDVPEGETESSYLRKLVFQGAARRYGNVPKEDLTLVTEAKAQKLLNGEVLDRIEFELGVIDKMGYAGYFLIVADLINWSKNRGVICGPGRGSAAGSIVAYATNITDLDPLQYDLLFERFLNPDRISMPDIDMDYADDRREEVIAYATEKYGQDRVAQIITFGIMAARNAVRDTGRVLGMPYGEVDAIAKLIPAPVQGRHIPLSKSIKNNSDLRNEYHNNPRAKNVIDIAMRLEGTIRNAGTHAAGVVISKDPIVDYAPLTRASKGGIATQYSMNPVEDIGLLKFDFLGLSNLTIIKNALRIIKKVYGNDIDIAEIPLDDQKTYALLARGETTGVFQLESAGMKRYIKELKPNRFEDIVAMVALYRPGPMQWIDDFINRKHNPKLINYEHPKMEAALKNTYGIIVYQEQVMQIAKDLCGFTGGQADTLRKGIGKKIPEVLGRMKQDFIEGAIKHSQVERNFVEMLWKSLEDFAAYCFNKSHAACYALIAIQTAYLKAHYPSAFMAALMTSDYGNIDRIAIEVAECKKMGINVLPPDINESFQEFAVVKDTNDIRFGLAAVKNVGIGVIEEILKAREDEPFTSVEDFMLRVNTSEINRKSLESLVKVGAFDKLHDRSMLMFNLDKLLAFGQRIKKNISNGQIDIFGSLGITHEVPNLKLDLPDRAIDNRELLAWEKDLLGLYISRHPLDPYDLYFADKTVAINKLDTSSEGKKIILGGIVTAARKITTKNGNSMLFATLENKTGSIELIIFPKVFDKKPALWAVDNVVVTQGKISFKDRNGKMGDEPKMMVDRANLADPKKAQEHTKVAKTRAINKTSKKPSDILKIKFNDLANTVALLKIKKILENRPGENFAYLIVSGDTPRTIKLPYKIAIEPPLLKELSNVVGKENLST